MFSGGGTPYRMPVNGVHQKSEDDVKQEGLKLKQHEDDLKYLKTLKKKLDESILDKRASLESYDKARTSKTMEGDPAHLKSEEVTIQNILKHENSAAALCFMFKKQAETMSSDHSLTKDVIGVVATLGKVDDENLSRLLSKYLGLENMLAVVCKTYEGAKTLDVGLHAFADSIQMPLSDQFTVISLEDIRPYAGESMDEDPQQRLALRKPLLPDGKTPPGFLGFAVNMISIDINDLHYNSKNGHNLRETLFYHLFSSLQVYRSKEDMLRALPCISNGAISLDGGMVRSPAVYTFGRNPQDVDVKFPIGRLNPPESYIENIKGLKEAMWKRDQTIKDIQMEEKLLDRSKVNYELKKDAFFHRVAQSSLQMYGSQFIPNYPAGRGSTSK